MASHFEGAQRPFVAGIKTLKLPASSAPELCWPVGYLRD